MYPTPAVRLLLLLIALALLCAVPVSAWAAPTIVWYRVLHSTILGTDMSGNATTYWSPQIGVRVHSESPEIGLAAVTVTEGDVTHWNCTNRWPANDGTGDECFCTTWDDPELPPGGPYALSACDWWGVPSEAVITTAPTRFLEPAAEVTAPAPGGVTSETSPAITWPAFPGFTGESMPSVARQGVGASRDSDGACLWRSCDHAPGETSAVYTGDPLLPGQVYTARLWEMAPDVSLDGPVPGVYCEQTGRLWAFAEYSPAPTVESYRLAHVTLLRSGDSSPRYASVIGIRFGSVWERERVTGVSVQPPGGETQSLAFWPVCGNPGAEVALCGSSESAEPPAIPAGGGTYTVTVVADSGETTFLAGPVTHFPEPVPAIAYPAPGQIFDPAQPFAWEPYAGFTCEGPTPLPAAWQSASVETLDESVRLWSCELGPESAEVPYGAGAESPPLLEPGQSYLFKLEQVGPDLPRDPIGGGPPGVFREQARADSAFAIYSPEPVITSVVVGRGSTAYPDGTIRYRSWVPIVVRDLDGRGDIASVSVTDSWGDSHEPYLERFQSDSDPNTGYYMWDDGGHETPSPPGTYTVTVTDKEGHTDTAVVAVSSVPGSPGCLPAIESPVDLSAVSGPPTFSWSVPEGIGCYCLLTREVDGACATWCPQGPVSSPLAYGGSDLLPGRMYASTLISWLPDDVQQSDPRVSSKFMFTDQSRFYIYSPVPVVTRLEVRRGRDVSPEGAISYHQRAMVYATDCDGAAGISSLRVTDSQGIQHEAPKVCERDQMTAAFCWDSWPEEAPSPAGTYTATVTDQGGNTGTAVTQVSALPTDPGFMPVLGTPANGSVATATPEFTWSVPLGEGCYCLTMREVDGPCQVWCPWQVSSPIGYGGTDLLASHLYDWSLRSSNLDPIVQSDPAAISRFQWTVTHDFWAQPKLVGFLEPINDDGSSVFRLGAIVPVKFQLVKADGSQVTDATCELHLAKVTDNVTGTELEVVSAGAADRGNTFRYATDHYQFNLDTKVLSTGTYRLWVTINGDVVHETTISLQ